MTKLSGDDIILFKKCFPRWCCCFSIFVGASNRLGVLWLDILVKIRVKEKSRNWMWMEVESNQLFNKFNFINIYGPNSSTVKKSL